MIEITHLVNIYKVSRSVYFNEYLQAQIFSGYDLEKLFDEFKLRTMSSHA